MLHALVRRRQKPIGPGLLEELLGELLGALVGVAGVVEELGDLLVRHHVPDSVRGEDSPLGHVAALLLILFRVVGEGRYLRLSDYARLLGEHVAERPCHGETRVRLVEHPDARWA